MNKKEVIWREILVQARVSNRNLFTQQELAADFGFSLSTVFNALKIPRQAHIVSVSGRNFRLDSYQKLLYLWATNHNLKKDLLFQTYLDFDAKKIESIMPPYVEFGLYSAYAFLYGQTPADYDHVYIYSDPSLISEVIKRLPEVSGRNLAPNFFILKKDPWFFRYKSVSPEQIFSDIWNSPEWYAKDFLRALEEKLPI